MSYTRKPYEESEEVKAARDALATHDASKPAYVSSWGGQLNDALDKILNRGSFNYDINGDALYQQYKDKYVQQGKMAMQDTVGQASALTGGYGNSWAATAGNQAYQAHLNNLNDVVPELYALAYDKYSQEGNDLRQQYALLADKEATDYGRYKDQLSAWNTDRAYLQGALDDASKRDYDQYLADEETRKAMYDAIEADDIKNNSERELKTGIDSDSVKYWGDKLYYAAVFGSEEDVKDIQRMMILNYGYSYDSVQNILDYAMNASSNTAKGNPPSHQSVNGWYDTIMSTAGDEVDGTEPNLDRFLQYLDAAEADGISKGIILNWAGEWAEITRIDLSEYLEEE